MIDVMESAARQGGAVLTKYFGQIYHQSYKDTPRNIVTQADIESQKIIVDKIIRLMTKKGIKKNDLGFIGEENLYSLAEHTFIIDPLDGTTNFSIGLDFFCIPIAYAENGQVMASVVYQPILDILYYAEIGKGSFKKTSQSNKQLTLKFKPLNETVATAHISANPQSSNKTLRIVSRLQSETIGVRHLGVTALEQCLLTENVFGAVVNSRTYIWDSAASGLIIKEAGGILTNWHGQKITYDLSNPDKTYNSIAVHPKNLPLILKYF